MRQCAMSWAAAVVLVVSVSASRGVAELPGTLNFRNVTTTNVHQLVAEIPSNEKEVEFGDFDNDGDLDVAVANALSDFGQRRNKLYRNDDGVFNEVSGSPAIPGFSGTDVSRNAFFRDYNNDGWLDLIIVNDNNTGGDPGRTKIYINNHPGGVFSHFTEEGLARLGSGTGGAACGAVSFDANQDGNVDLYVGNYPGPSQDTMYFDSSDGFFTNVTTSHVPADSAYTVDVVAGDMNGDGNMDVLISNFSSNMLYYNNRNNAGSGAGDFRYSGSTQALGDAASSENAMEVGDFDNDGLLDIYWSNRQSGGGDRIYRNTGNDAENRAMFVELGAQTLPPSVTSVVSRKATAVDLNGDGRLDVVVMKEDSGDTRPTILRNTTVGSEISFVDWTPASAFQDGSVHEGWHAAAFDGVGDDRVDIFLGGFNNDHLFEQVDSNEVTDAELGGVISGLLNADPIAIVGEADGIGDDYEISDVGANRMMSIVLSGCGDFVLRVANSGGGTVAMSDRGGIGVEEALQLVTPAAPFFVEVLVSQACGDGDGDGFVALNDYDAYLDCVSGPGGGVLSGCSVFDVDEDGDVDFGDYRLFQTIFSGVGSPAIASYQLEILARS